MLRTDRRDIVLVAVENDDGDVAEELRTDRDGAQAYHFENDVDSVIVCRGTEPDDINDVKADVNALAVAAETVGRVHRGFKSECDQLWPMIERAIKDNPKPLWFAGHSLGGAIALRAVLEGLDVKSAVFTGPMWGIMISPVLRPGAWALYLAGGPLGFVRRLAPTLRPENYVASSPFEGNTLTSARAMWDGMKRQVTAEPGLTIGGPTIRWVGEALRECRWLMRQPARALPAICFTGAEEAIVSVPAMRDRMARWPGGRFVSIPGAHHEVLMEAPAIRDRLLDDIAAHMDAA